MTQLSILTKDLGWGDLQSELDNLKKLHQKVKTDEETTMRLKNSVHQIITKMNENRRKRVIYLLKKEGRGICLCHKLVFRESEIEESLVPMEKMFVIQINKSWTERVGCYDGDKEEVSRNKRYETVACSLCRDVMMHASVTDKNWVTHSVVSGNRIGKEDLEKFYTNEILDEISEKYFQMPVLAFEKMSSL